MDKAQALEQILQISHEHELDRDGGYSLVGAIRRTSEGSAGPDRIVMAEVLGELVQRQESRLWGVALEALVQLGEVGQVAMLAHELDSAARSDEWKDNLVLGLLRLGQEQFRDTILKHISQSLRSGGDLTVPMIAALFRIDREACLSMAVTFFEDSFARGRKIDGFIPAFVRNFVAVDELAIAELVRRLTVRRAEAGRWLAGEFDAYLAKPWMTRELGSDRVSKLRRELRHDRHGAIN